jgi:peptidyl-prolyl cis-trans isomerase A (cyclophilin A)
MNSIRRLAAFAVVFSVASLTACAPLNRARTQLAATQDTLAKARAIAAQRDSVFMPADFSAPDSFLVAFETTKGRFDVMAHRSWAPIGTTQFYELVHRHFYDSVFFHRVVKGFVAQFGMNGDPAVGAAWSNRRIADEPNTQSNTRGRVSYARSGLGTRTTQLFINIGNNARLDAATPVIIPGTQRADTIALGYPPFAEVVRGMEVVDSLNSEYASAPNNVPDSLRSLGVNAFFRQQFPKLDMIKTARILQEWRRPRR